MPIIIQTLYSLAQIANHHAKLPFCQTLVLRQFAIPLTPSRLPFSFSGALAILPFRHWISRQISQRSHHHCHQHNLSCFLFRLCAGYEWNNSQWSTYTRTHHTNLPTPKGFSWLETNQEPKNWRTTCLSTIRPSYFSLSVSPPSRPISRSNLPEMPLLWTRPQSLALRMSCRWRHKAKSVWKSQRVRRVTCHSSCGCGGVWLEDLGQPWPLTK